MTEGAGCRDLPRIRDGHRRDAADPRIDYAAPGAARARGRHLATGICRRQCRQAGRVGKCRHSRPAFAGRECRPGSDLSTRCLCRRQAPRDTDRGPTVRVALPSVMPGLVPGCPVLRHAAARAGIRARRRRDVDARNKSGHPDGSKKGRAEAGVPDVPEIRAALHPVRQSSSRSGRSRRNRAWDGFGGPGAGAGDSGRNRKGEKIDAISGG